MPLYVIAREQMLTPSGTLGATNASAIAWNTDTIHAQLVNSTYVYNAAHTTFDTTNVPSGARVGTSVALSGKTSTGGVAKANATTFTAVPSGTPNAVIIFKNLGSGTGQMIFYVPTASITGFPITSNGGDITLSWNATDGIYRINSV